MSKRRDEVKAAVNSIVYNIFPVQATLITEVLLKLLVQVIRNWFPTKKKCKQVNLLNAMLDNLKYMYFVTWITPIVLCFGDEVM